LLDGGVVERRILGLVLVEHEARPSFVGDRAPRLVEADARDLEMRASIAAAARFRTKVHVQRLGKRPELVGDRRGNDEVSWTEVAARSMAPDVPADSVDRHAAREEAIHD